MTEPVCAAVRPCQFRYYSSYHRLWPPSLAQLDLSLVFKRRRWHMHSVMNRLTRLLHDDVSSLKQDSRRTCRGWRLLQASSGRARP